MGKWKKKTLRMKENHGWRSTPGYNLCVIDRGALQIEIPQGWITVPGEKSIKLHDRPHPDDDFVVEISVLHFPPIDYSELPITQLLLSSADRKPAGVGEIIRVDRDDIEIAWYEYTEFDQGEQREAVWKHAICRCGGIHAVITFGHWPEKIEEGAKLWSHFLKTLIMGRRIEDPTQGPRFH